MHGTSLGQIYDSLIHFSLSVCSSMSKTILHIHFRFYVEEHKTFCSDKRNLGDSSMSTTNKRAYCMWRNGQNNWNLLDFYFQKNCPNFFKISVFSHFVEEYFEFCVVYNSWKTRLTSLKFLLKLEHKKLNIKSEFQLSITLLSGRILHYTTKCRRTFFLEKM